MTGSLTYRQLLNYLKILEADESPMLDLDVTVKDETDEFRSIAHIMVTHEDDVLDKDHPYLITCEDPADDDEESTYESELNRTPWTAYKSPNRW
jgi:hypothetical protein